MRRMGPLLSPRCLRPSCPQVFPLPWALVYLYLHMDVDKPADLFDGRASPDSPGAAASVGRPLTDADKLERYSGLMVALNPRMRYHSDLERAKFAWFNATLVDVPDFILGEHYLVPLFIERMLALRNAKDYSEISPTLESLQNGAIFII